MTLERVRSDVDDPTRSEADRAPESIILEGGTVIRVDGRPAQGTRHEVLFGVLRGTGERVVVKVERIPGALDVVHRALRWLTTQRGPAPRLIAASSVLFHGRRPACLVTQRAAGTAPTTMSGWKRLGRALARLVDVPCCGCDLTVLDPRTFGDRHAQRIQQLGMRLEMLADTVEDWVQLRSPAIPGATDLVLTHGDPGPGNFLGDNAAGTLIDWEAAQIVPLGLDVARAIFIALLGAGPPGYPARHHHQRAEAVAHGYFAQVSDRWRPTTQQLRWWLTVAGIQFVHRRWQRAGEPGVASWTDAIETLRAALTAPNAEVSFDRVSFIGPDPVPPPYVSTSRGPDRSQLAQARALEGTSTFAVRATFMGSGRRGQQKHLKGELFISPEEIVFLSRGIGESLRFDHSEPDVTMVKGRLCPPWANTFLFLQSRDSTVRVAAPMSARRGLRRALRDAGVTLHERSSSHTPELPRRGGRRT